VGWLDWVRETAAKVGEVVRTGLRGIIDLPEEIRPVIFPRPETPEAIEEIVEELVYTDRFIEEALPPEALRLARGVLYREPLTNVARLREWTAARPEDIIPGSNEIISQRRVLVGPDGQMTHVDIAGGYGTPYDADEFLRKAAAALDDDFVSQYDIGRSALVRQYTVAVETYIQTYVPL